MRHRNKIKKSPNQNEYLKHDENTGETPFGSSGKTLVRSIFPIENIKVITSAITIKYIKISPHLPIDLIFFVVRYASTKISGTKNTNQLRSTYDVSL